MNKDILNTVNQEFINNNLDSDLTTLLFKKNKNITVAIKELVEQIDAKKRIKKKLPTWFNSDNIYYPNKLNLEQSSSELTAQYKSGLIKGNLLIDITGGFGVDSYYFSKQFKKVFHCEINEGLSKIVDHNNKQFKIRNIQCIRNDGIEYLINSEKTFDWIYIDPSRRHESKGKVFFLKDCLPNIPEQLGLIFKRSKNILVKTSPLLDITIGAKELKNVKAIHVVAVKNEVKELLWILEKNYSNSIDIFAVNIKQDTDVFQFKLFQEKTETASYSKPLSYLYEPNTAILKAGAFKSISVKLRVHKLNQNTHLYTLDQLISFPGRRFKINKIIPYNKKLLKKEFIFQANITVRNFSESVKQIRTKFNIKDGGETYLFFTTDIDNKKIVLVCVRI